MLLHMYDLCVYVACAISYVCSGQSDAYILPPVAINYHTYVNECPMNIQKPVGCSLAHPTLCLHLIDKGREGRAEGSGI